MGFRGGGGGRLGLRTLSDTQKSNLYIITKGVGDMIWVKISQILISLTKEIQGKPVLVTFWAILQKDRNTILHLGA